MDHECLQIPIEGKIQAINEMLKTRLGAFKNKIYHKFKKCSGDLGVTPKRLPHRQSFRLWHTLYLDLK